MIYRIAWNDFRLQVNHGEEVTQVEVPIRKLALSWSDFAEWLKGALPPEWFPKAPAGDDDFDKTG